MTATQHKIINETVNINVFIGWQLQPKKTGKPGFPWPPGENATAPTWVRHDDLSFLYFSNYVTIACSSAQFSNFRFSNPRFKRTLLGYSPGCFKLLATLFSVVCLPLVTQRCVPFRQHESQIFHHDFNMSHCRKTGHTIRFTFCKIFRPYWTPLEG